ncbi:TPA: hypothetical protein DDZ86_02660 [Candidatus Dependentiae bacterium]|nr:MAG: hypothetical protein UW09_C0001G0116 [candidate division TM6 bacterium GW2011_GWF2_43_87]HBL98520.1 hypothetical protein [Candidatus Dependentiae bacterium]
MKNLKSISSLVVLFLTSASCLQSGTLHDLVSNGDINGIKNLLKKPLFIFSYFSTPVNVDERDVHGDTALILACGKNNIRICKFLIENGASLNIQNNAGDTALHVACEKGHIGIVGFLFDKGANLNLKNNNGDTALHTACEKSNVQIVQSLITKGANLNLKNNDGNTVLFLACKVGDANIAKLLIEGGADLSLKTNAGNSALILACKAGHATVTSTAKLLIENGASIGVKDISGNTPLHLACLNYYFDIVKLLIGKGVDFNVKNGDGKTPVDLLGIQGTPRERFELCMLLVKEYGKDIIAQVKLLMQSGVDFNAKDENGNTLLHLVCKRGLIEIVKCLVEKGACVNVKNNDGAIPFDLLRKKGTPKERAEICILLIKEKGDGSAPSVKLLLQGKVSLKTIDKDGNSSMHWACKRGLSEMVQLLIEKGADICVKNSDNKTPFDLFGMKGSSNERTKFFMRLIKNGFAPASMPDALRQQGWFNFDTKDENGDTLFHLACEKGLIELVKIITEKKAPVVVNIYDWTPLHYACAEGFAGIVELLIKKGASVNAIDMDGWTPLHYACVGGHVEVVKLLINNGADFYVKNSDSKTPLDLLITKGTPQGRIELCRLLIEKNKDSVELSKIFMKSKIDLNAKDENGYTLLHSACKTGSIDVVKFLVEKGVILDSSDIYNWTPLHHACSAGFTDIVKLLVGSGASVNVKDIDGWTPLHVACREGFTDIAKYLIDNGANVCEKDTGNNTPLHHACYFNFPEIIKLLVEKGAFVGAKDTRNCTPLHIACLSGSLESVLCLIEKGANIYANNCDYKTPLDLLGAHGTPEERAKLCMLLIKKNVNDRVTPAVLVGQGRIYLNATDDTGNTLLHWVCKAGFMDIAKILIEKGADVYTKNKANEIPFDLLGANGTPQERAELCMLLIKKNSVVEVNESVVGSILVLCKILKSTSHPVKLLIQGNIDLSITDANGNTLLHCACASNFIEIVKLLIEKGASINAKNINSETPLEIAKKKGFVEVVKLFEVN